MKGFPFSKITKSKNVRKLLGNFTYLTILQFAGYVFPLITIPYLARVIGVDGFGRIAFAAGIVLWVQTIVDWGFSYTATREVARQQDNKIELSRILSNVLCAKFVLMVVSFFLFFVCVLFIPSLWEDKWLYFFAFLLVPGHIIFPEWFFQGLERMKYITILNLLSKTLFTLLVFVVVKEKSDYIFQPLLTSLGYLLAGIIALILIIIKWRIPLVKPQMSTVLLTIKGSANMFINQIFPNLYNSVGVVLLGVFHGSAANGILNAAWKFVNIAISLFTNVSKAFFPYLSKGLKNHAAFAKMTICLAILFAFCIFLSAPLLIELFYTDEFKSAIPVLRIFSFAIVFHVVSNVFGINYMVLDGCEAKLKMFTIVSSVLAFLLSVPMIYCFSYIGMAVSFLFGRFLMALFTSVFVIRHGKEYI